MNLGLLNKPYKIIAFDWDGTAVKDRSASTDELLPVMESLLSKGIKVLVITGTHFGNVKKQFADRVKPELKRNLMGFVNRGSQVFGFDKDGNEYTVHERVATEKENNAMDEIAHFMINHLKEKYGLHIEVVFDRVNRRKVDIYPEWIDPPKEQINELLEKVEEKLTTHGVKGGISELIDLLDKRADEYGIKFKVTTDVKHLEYGLTDKTDSVDYIINEIAKKEGIENKDIMFLGDEFGPIGGYDGSDFKMVAPSAEGSVYVSVGKEPNGVPAGVHLYGKGPDGFLEIMKLQDSLTK